MYRSKSCDRCPLKDKCVKAKNGLRTIELNRKLRKYRAQIKENLESEKELELRARRGPEVDTPFGHIKYNRLYRRIRLRGIKKVETEMAWLFMAYNFTKMAKAKSA
ncbi:MAG: transposase [Lentisphaerales bacterium]|nr:transposase [Lentisphaerales bacterium]